MPWRSPIDAPRPSERQAVRAREEEEEEDALCIARSYASKATVPRKDVFKKAGKARNRMRSLEARTEVLSLPFALLDSMGIVCFAPSKWFRISNKLLIASAEEETAFPLKVFGSTNPLFGSIIGLPSPLRREEAVIVRRKRGVERERLRTSPPIPPDHTIPDSSSPSAS